MTELPGQMTLFTLDGCTAEVQAGHADEVCAACGGWRTSSPECVTEAGLYPEDIFDDRSEW